MEKIFKFLGFGFMVFTIVFFSGCLESTSPTDSGAGNGNITDSRIGSGNTTDVGVKNVSEKPPTLPFDNAGNVNGTGNITARCRKHK